MGFLSLEIRKGYPIYNYHDRPDFGKDIHARNKYIEQEIRRLHEGWEGLTGFDYFDLAKNKLHDNTTGSLLNPDFLYDQKKLRDDLLFCKNHKLQQQGFPVEGNDHPVIINGNTIPDPYDPVCIKPRRWGWTSIISSFMIYNAWLMEGCTQGATSCDDNRLKDLVADKLFYSREGCIEEKLLAEEGRWNSRFVSFIFKNGEQIKKSTIWTPNTSIDDKAAQSPEGFGYAVYFLDEWFLHSRATIVAQSVKATLLNRKKQKEGIMIRGGSCSAEMDIDSINRIKHILNTASNPDMKIKVIFIEGWKCQVVDEFGFTDEEKSKEKKFKEREILRKAAMNGDTESWLAWMTEIKNFPNSLQELIGGVEGDYFSPSIIQNLEKGKIYAFNNEPRRCNLVERNNTVFPDDEVRNIPDLFFPKSTRFPYSIYEMPQPDDICIAGADPINFTGANEKGSMFAMVAKSVTRNKYLASALFRTTDSSLGYNLFINFLRLFKSNRYPNGALCMAEKNALGSIVSLCQMNGNLDLLARDPFKNTYASNTDRGYHKSMETMPRIMAYGRSFLENGFVPFDGFNDAFKEYRDDSKKTKKADICDAFLGCELLYNTMLTQVEKKDVRYTIETARDQNGNIFQYSKQNF